MPEQIIPVKVTADDIEDGRNGVCLSCGMIHHGGIEPDARKYKCDSCEEHEVYGLEEALIMGKVEIADDLDME